MLLHPNINHRNNRATEHPTIYTILHVLAYNLTKLPSFTFPCAARAVGYTALFPETLAEGSDQSEFNPFGNGLGVGGRGRPRSGKGHRFPNFAAQRPNLAAQRPNFAAVRRPNLARRRRAPRVAKWKLFGRKWW